MVSTDRIIGTFNYGLCAFSIDTMTEFLMTKKMRSKKVLELLQKDKALYLDSVKEGVWMPIPSINSGRYVIKVEGCDDPFSEEWTQVLSYDGFHIDVKNGLWISDIGSLLKFDRKEFEGEGREVSSGAGTADYFSNREIWHKDLAGAVHHSAYWYDIPDGKHLLTITGFARKEITDARAVNYGFRFGLEKVDAFTGCKNPREESYEFNVEWIFTTKPAVVHWLPEKESGVKWPLEKENPTKSIIVIPLENGQNAYLRMKFDTLHQTEENTNDCRLQTWLKTPKDFLLESGKDYTIYEEIYKRGKYTYRKLGQLTVK